MLQGLLRDALRISDLVQVSESFRVPAARMISLAEERGLEGVVPKRLTGLYESGRRSGAWQKLCLTQAQEFVARLVSQNVSQRRWTLISNALELLTGGRDSHLSD